MIPREKYGSRKHLQAIYAALSVQMVPSHVMTGLSTPLLSCECLKLEFNSNHYSPCSAASKDLNTKFVQPTAIRQKPMEVIAKSPFKVVTKEMAANLQLTWQSAQLSFL
jgi:hypothetical protein